MKDSGSSWGANKTDQSVCGEDFEVTERFTYLGSDIHVSAGCEPEVNRRLGRAWGVIDSLDHGV